MPWHWNNRAPSRTTSGIVGLSVLTSLVQVRDSAIMLLLREIVHLNQLLHTGQRHYRTPQNDSNHSIIPNIICETLNSMYRLIVSAPWVHTFCPVIIMLAPFVVISTISRKRADLLVHAEFCRFRL